VFYPNAKNKKYLSPLFWLLPLHLHLQSSSRFKTSSMVWPRLRDRVVGLLQNWRRAPVPCPSWSQPPESRFSTPSTSPRPLPATVLLRFRGHAAAMDGSVLSPGSHERTRKWNRTQAVGQSNTAQQINFHVPYSFPPQSFNLSIHPTYLTWTAYV
jgi:hypothetical protein